MIALLSAALTLASCSAGGSVEIVLNPPDVEELSPFGDGLAEITLVRMSPGEPPTRTPREYTQGGQEVDMGAIEPGDAMQLAVELRSVSQRLVGYGRSPVMDVGQGADVTIPIHLRRPFVYVTGDTSLATFDATRDPNTESYRSQIGSFDPTAAATPLPDGTGIAVASGPTGGGSFTIISTSDHMTQLAGPIAIQGLPVDVAISASGRYAVIAHASDSGGVSIVDLEQALTGSGTATFVPIGHVGRVAVTPAGVDTERAFAVTDSGPEIQCGISSSAIHSISLPDGQLGSAISFSNPIADIAVSGDPFYVAAADPCDDVVMRINPDDDVAERPTLLSVDSPSSLALADGRLWVAGSTVVPDEVGTRLAVVSVGTDGQGETRIELPSLQERARTEEFSSDGEEASRLLDADVVTPFDLAVLPGAESVAVLMSSVYHAAERGDFFGQPVLPEMTVSNREYLLIDTANTTVVQRVRTNCELMQLSVALISDWECTQSPGQDITDAKYTPLTVSALYGAR